MKIILLIVVWMGLLVLMVLWLITFPFSWLHEKIDDYGEYTSDLLEAVVDINKEKVE